MTSYPINFSCDRDGEEWSEGFAVSAAEAAAKVQSDRGAEWKVTGAERATCEVGPTYRDRAEFERAWAAEIEAGWVQPIQVWSGWKGEATFWATREEEV
jgi:hypothetical protein